MEECTIISYKTIASGYGRSEGVVFFYLQRAEDAKRNYGEIKFCDSQYFGSTIPNFIRFDETHLKTSMRHLFELNHFHPDTSNIGFVEMNAYGQEVIFRAYLPQ